MNIRKEYPKVCLFLWILGMCFHAHPILAQSVIPVPLEMEQGTGSFLLSEKTKLYTNLQGGEAELWEVDQLVNVGDAQRILSQI